ncbi:MAG: hypothetical protein D3925_10435, partial [Candidatus Electrothrix sp. AR5]|nr:hypothetical protein [Candidatus Electrothrix sp. AR5]
MSSERISDEKAADIEKALKKHSRFLAYVRVNALLHDCDKATAEFLRWSLDKNSVSQEEYPGHNVFQEARQAFLEHKEELFPPHELGPITAPVKRVALEPLELRREMAVDLLQHYCGDENFISKLADSSLKELHAYFQLDKNDRPKRNFFDQNYTSIFKNGLFSALTDQDVNATVDWLCEFRSGTSLYDFHVWHHSPNFWLKTNHHAATALLLFSAGTAYIDGLDTKYETETEQKKAREHHTPNLSVEDSILIASPFGYERKVKRSSASLLLKKSKSIENFLMHWQQGNAVSHTLALEKAIRPSFEQTVI